MEKSHSKKIFISVILTIFLLPIFSITVKAADTKPLKKTNDFILNDADKKPFRFSEHKGKVLVFSFIPDMDNRKTGAYWLAESRKWMQELNQKFGERIEVFGLKEMTDLPMFLPKSVVRAKLRKEPFPYLIDWDGKVFKQFSVDKVFTLMVIDANGNIVYRLSEPFNSDTFNAVCLEIEKLIPANLKAKTIKNPDNSKNN